MNRDDKIAVFRYGIIAPVIHDGSINRSNYFRELAKKEFYYPGEERPVRFRYRTFLKWLHLYRKHGYDGLKPTTRNDKGKSRKIGGFLKEQITNLCNEYDFKTVSNLYRFLVSEGIIQARSFTEVTLRNFMLSENIRFKPEGKKPRKAFEVPHINMLWTADIMYGPYIKIGKKNMRSYLFAIIDDHSRLITAASFYNSDGSLSLAKTLRDAISVYGLPQKFYCDNGKVFSSGYLHMLCAKLGIALIHSKPYDSPSRGKIERFFRTVRDMFLPMIFDKSELTFESLNEKFKTWVMEQYNLNEHRGINDTPMDRYLHDMENVKIKKLTEHQAEHYFYNTIHRTVKNDSTITVNNMLYETPAKYIGRKIEIRFPLDRPDDLRLFEDDKQVTVLKKLDKHFNSELKIRYNSDVIEDEENRKEDKIRKTEDYREEKNV